jgi:sugar phosphate isomerase/epimerase
MRLGISSWTYTWAVAAPDKPLGVMDLLDKASALGVRVLQIADNLPLDQLPESDLTAFSESTTKTGISIEVGTRGISHDNLCTYLRLAQRLGSPILRVVIDTAEHRPTETEVVEALKGIIVEFERGGVCLAIENHDRFTTKALRRIVEKVGSDHLGICLDVANSFGALEGPEVVVDTLAPLAVNLHIKDFDVFRAHQMMGFLIEGRQVGQGRLDIPWLLNRLRAAKVDPNAILEQWTPPEETLAQTIAKEDRWATNSVRYLRQFILD